MGRIVINDTFCKGCELCIPACPKGLIKPGKNLNRMGYYFVIFEDKDGGCNGCTLCAVVCPDTAIEVYR